MTPTASSWQVGGLLQPGSAISRKRQNALLFFFLSLEFFFQTSQEVFHNKKENVYEEKLTWRKARWFGLFHLQQMIASVLHHKRTAYKSFQRHIRVRT